MGVTFLLIPGAGGQAWYWHRVVPLLMAEGHRAVAVDLPADDDNAGLTAYRDTALTALDASTSGGSVGSSPDPLVVVGQSLGGLVAPLLCAKRPVMRLVLVNAMVPLPAETGGDWWQATGQAEAAAASARREGRLEQFDPVRDFFHDVPPDVTEQALAEGAPPQSGTPFGEPWPLAAWPAVPTRVVVGRDDRLFPAAFQRRVARERLGADVAVEEIPGGHLVALSHPQEVAGCLLADPLLRRPG